MEIKDLKLARNLANGKPKTISLAKIEEKLAQEGQHAQTNASTRAKL